MTQTSQFTLQECLQVIIEDKANPCLPVLEREDDQGNRYLLYCTDSDDDHIQINFIGSLAWRQGLGESGCHVLVVARAAGPDGRSITFYQRQILAYKPATAKEAMEEAKTYFESGARWMTAADSEHYRLMARRLGEGLQDLEKVIGANDIRELAKAYASQPREPVSQDLKPANLVTNLSWTKPVVDSGGVEGDPGLCSNRPAPGPGNESKLPEEGSKWTGPSGLVAVELVKDGRVTFRPVVDRPLSIDRSVSDFLALYKPNAPVTGITTFGQLNERGGDK